MEKIAIVVQRCHETIVGGSEALAWQFATLLAGQYEVEILTSTAIDYSTWSNSLPEGTEIRQGVKIKRFNVAFERSLYWHQLHEKLLRHQNIISTSENTMPVPWPLALQEEFILRQGPYCPGLLHYLKHNYSEYKSVLLVTYLYPTTYFGLLETPGSKSLFIPTLHNELPAYLSAFRHAAQKARSIIWLTKAEKTVCQRLWGDVSGKVVGMAIETSAHAPYTDDFSYALYCGRIDSSKGCDHLLSYFLEYKKAFPSNLKLILTGDDKIGIPHHPDIIYKGFVSSEEKFSLMAGADVFILPSPFESFSISLLEAMAQRTLPLVNGKCEVLAEHIALSGAGQVYYNQSSFIEGLNTVLNWSQNNVHMKEQARNYVISHYSVDMIRQALIEQIEFLAKDS